MIWGDFGFDELVPLSAMGEGMARAARLFIALIHIQGGIVMVDEIENGFHHSVVPKVWEAIDEMSQELRCAGIFDHAQSTNACECGARKRLGEEGFRSTTDCMPMQRVRKPLRHV